MKVYLLFNVAVSIMLKLSFPWFSVTVFDYEEVEGGFKAGLL